MRTLLVTLFVGMNFVLSSCSKDENLSHADHGHKSIEEYYTCSMHPSVKQDRPGKCPICHMNLTKVEVEKGESPKVVAERKEQWRCENFPDVVSEVQDVCPIDGTPMIKVTRKKEAGETVARVKLRKAQLSHFNPSVFPATTMKMQQKVRLLGRVYQSEERESNIPAKIGGRVEKVYVKSTGSFVKEGDPVIDLYSPKLITAGEEYILARKSAKSNKSKEFKEILKQSEQRLTLWGIKKSQYSKWYKENKVPRKITIYSDETGIVRKRNATVGKYFKEGENFFELSDLSDVWVEFDVYEQDSSYVEIGQKVDLEFTSLPGKVIEGTIDFVAPVIDEVSRTLKIRATIPNTEGRLKPGMAADATLHINYPGMPLVIPRTAIIDTGKRKVVWTKIAGKEYQAKTVFTGVESEGYVEVKSGLMEDEEVVIEGNFLLDAQAQLFGGYEEMK